MKLVYPAILEPFDDGDGYTVTVPDLPGCVTEGDSLAEAIDMGIDAASGWILGEIEEGNNYPAASSASEIKVSDPDCLVTLLVLDMDAYAERYGTKAVRRNITIPAWLDTYAQRNNLSLSKVIQDRLLEYAGSQKRL